MGVEKYLFVLHKHNLNPTPQHTLLSSNKGAVKELIQADPRRRCVVNRSLGAGFWGAGRAFYDGR